MEIEKTVKFDVFLLREDRDAYTVAGCGSVSRNASYRKALPTLRASTFERYNLTQSVSEV